MYIHFTNTETETPEEARRREQVQVRKMRLQLIQLAVLGEPQGLPPGGGGAGGEGTLPRVWQWFQLGVASAQTHGPSAPSRRQEVPQVPHVRLGLQKHK